MKGDGANRHDRICRELGQAAGLTNDWSLDGPWRTGDGLVWLKLAA
jgi:hypothetical protein